MPGPNRRDFLARTAGFLAAAAVAKLPVLDAPTSAVEPPPVKEASEILYASAEGDWRPREVVSFNVFGRNVMYSAPGVRR